MHEHNTAFVLKPELLISLLTLVLIWCKHLLTQHPKLQGTLRKTSADIMLQGAQDVYFSPPCLLAIYTDTGVWKPQAVSSAAPSRHCYNQSGELLSEIRAGSQVRAASHHWWDKGQ